MTARPAAIVAAAARLVAVLRRRLPAVVVAVAIGVPIPGPAAEPASRELFDEAVRLFFAAEPAASARVFDRLVLAAPRAEPALWQRGLALYYADRFDDGRRQFELHRTVNPADVENAAWHFLCVARLDGIEAARGRLLPVGRDARVPMREILDLYAGRCDPDDVVAAADRGAGEARRDQSCFAHLYVGLFHEARGDTARAREHITLAADTFSMDHFMGRVAPLHCRLRGWPTRAADRAR